MKTTYRGVRLQADQGTVSDVQVDVLHQPNDATSPKIARPLAHFSLHSPDGFSWGYHGSGPSDLALAILLDHLQETPTPEQVQMGHPLAMRLYQFFKREFVAGWGDTWEISGDEIDQWMKDPKIQKHVKQHAALWDELREIVEDADARQ